MTKLRANQFMIVMLFAFAVCIITLIKYPYGL